MHSCILNGVYNPLFGKLGRAHNKGMVPVLISPMHVGKHVELTVDGFIRLGHPLGVV